MDKFEHWGYAKETDSFYNGSIYCGCFDKEGRRSGYGKLSYLNGSFYEGEFMNDKKSGIGTEVSCNGDLYEGSFYEDQYHGYGVVSYLNGQIWEGRFENGRKVR